MTNSMSSSLLQKRDKHKHFSGLTGSALSYAVAQSFRAEPQPTVLILPTYRQILALKEELGFFLGDTSGLFTLPPLGVLPYFGLNASADAVAQRLAALTRLFQSREPFLALIPISALMRRVPPASFLNERSDYLVTGEEIDREDLFRRLIAAGYQNVPLVEDPGTFSRRGGIVDLFTPQHELPVRLEFFGDQLESLRFFDPETQRSREALSELVVLPAREVLVNEETCKKASFKFRERANEVQLSKEQREPFLESLRQGLLPASLETYLPLFWEKTTGVFNYFPKASKVLWVEPELSRQHYEELQAEIQHAYQACESVERVVAPQDLYLAWNEISTSLEKIQAIQMRVLPSGGDEVNFAIQGHEDLTALLTHAKLNEQMLQPLLERLHQWAQWGYRVGLIASSHTQLLRLEDLLERHQIPVTKPGEDFTKFTNTSTQSQRQVFLLEGSIEQGFVWPEEHLVLITDQEIFGKKKRRRQVGRRKVEAFSSFEDLSEGDYVVHEDHGLGIYRGLTQLQLDGQAEDFLLLEYLGEDKLYLPVYRLNVVSRYTAQEGSLPRLDKIGATSWEKNKTKVKKALKSIAGELLKLYAERATLPGYAFSPLGELYEEFEATFPFEETPDQLRAIQEVNEDMDQEKAMDRLVCGDVGFGKTEVAMRAAFRAILDGKQVAILVPTTVLALQHERNFRERFQNYPAEIAMLSRFVSSKEQQGVLDKLRQGRLDIVIGTHALLGKQVSFKSLGLLVVDEEQRFGVSQKEKIKQLKQQADVLTLTATPIPRTLNMSLSGIRDLSVITTPPVDRLSIQTMVATYNEALIQEAVHRELSRGGQVYFVHNRVQTIDKMYHRLKQILPDAKIKVGHGQMGERELEDVMLGFINREFNVFLCTAIVESGLDVPSANTMIVNRADTFGLAQLYQLRGRIGRSNARAFAYLLTPGQDLITPKARMRLSVLQRHTDLGSGFKIASHDLEIRGAGNLLGPEQSGHVAALGYDLYMRLLEEAINEVKGQEVSRAPEPELKLGLVAVIPESYVSEMGLRLSLYKRFASVESEEELEHLAEETKDRFGPLPQEVKNLITVMNVKLWAKRCWLRAVTLEPKRVLYSFDPQTPLAIEPLMERIAKEPTRFRWVKNHELAMNFKEGKEEQAVESVLKFLMELSSSSTVSDKK